MWYFLYDNQALGQLTIADIFDLSCRLGHGQNTNQHEEENHLLGSPKTCLRMHVHGNCKGLSKYLLQKMPRFRFNVWVITDANTQPDSQFILFDMGTAPESPRKRSCFEYSWKSVCS